MNERIKELWKEGTESVFPRYGDYVGVGPTNIEKFAELIVLECAVFARQHNLEKADRSHMIHKAIRQHFGVEE